MVSGIAIAKLVNKMPYFRTETITSRQSQCKCSQSNKTYMRGKKTPTDDSSSLSDKRQFVQLCDKSDTGFITFLHKFSVRKKFILTRFSEFCHDESVVTDAQLYGPCNEVCRRALNLYCIFAIPLQPKNHYHQPRNSTNALFENAN